MRIRFTQQCVKGAHYHSPIPEIVKRCEGAEQGPQKTEMRRGFSALSSPSWLAAESVSALFACRLAQLQECKLNANTESRIRADNKAVPEYDGGIKYDGRAQH